MIEVEDVWKSYGDLEVLKGLNLKVETGETLVILGRSGVGKSVLLRLLLGIEKPDKGRICIDDVCVNELQGDEVYKKLMHVGMLFQGAALFDSMSVQDNISFFYNEHRPENMTEEQLIQRVNESLKVVDLEGINDKMPSELSGGMKKRAAIARMYAYKPTVLFWDEPTTGLDPITSAQINDLIKTVKKELNATSIVVTHDILSALDVADRLALHEDGKIKYVEPVEQFMQIKDPTIEFLHKMTRYDKHK